MNQNPKEKQTVYTNKVFNSQNVEIKKKESLGIVKVTLEEYFSPEPKTKDKQEHT